ncbi:MAG TPA: UDP-N-acetylmuramate:L-alanyl-gamma-D-glutamyl-meso-diaminopimelate ligase [Burkholderiales bacterium]|nr:UDP-N-acetylmuramate:L-alanyl-gamma-D-glutamyl-meso-diaminopimelate ligase [Burkholderiales bacterium]
MRRYSFRRSYRSPRPVHIHILGICGTFMGGIAVIAKAAGHRVTGCDSNVYPPMSTQLAAEGIALTIGFGADQVALKPDLWVVGNVITRGNPLMEAILDRGDAYVSGPQWLTENALFGRRVLAVAGTHGKTTTSSMLAWILEDVGKAPGFLIGGVPKNLEVSARLGKKTDFVIEADEYDTAFFDKRSKMVHYRPRVAIVNNIEFDHADIFQDLAAIETQFHHFIRTVPRSGKLVVNGADPAIERVLRRGCWTEVERFGTTAGWSAIPAGRGCFEVLNQGRPLGLLRWELHGDHNQQNALAAIAAAQAAEVDPERAIVALSRFKNVRRRMELRGTSAGVAVWDDFAHHPTAIAATLSGMRDQVGSARILAVLEPRSNTMKAGVMKERLPASLEGADQIFCYSANLGWDARATLSPLGVRASIEDDLERLVEAIVNEARPGDQVLVMSNGAFGGIHDRLLAELSKRTTPATRE